MIPLVFSVVLGLTGYINYHFQIMQAESMAVARICLEHWKNGIDGKEMNPYTYSDLKAQINLKKRFDIPSLCLIVFSFILLFLNVFVSVYPSTQRGTTMP
jgi:hypothetical protein